MEVVSLAEVSAAAHALRGGDLIVVPTSRWYMLCGRADLPIVANRMFQAKRRPVSRPLLLVVGGRQTVRKHFCLPAAANRIADTFWPGDLAMLLTWRRPEEGRAMACVGDPVALVAMPAGTLGVLAELAGVPVAATSVNLGAVQNDCGTLPAVSVTEVEDFDARSGSGISLVLDGGICPNPTDMTIVDCTSEQPSVHRAGIVRTRSIAASLRGTPFALADQADTGSSAR